MSFLDTSFEIPETPLIRLSSIEESADFSFAPLEDTLLNDSEIFTQKTRLILD